MGTSLCKNCGIKFATETGELIGGKKYCSKCAPQFKKDSIIHKELCQYIYENIFQGECDMVAVTRVLKSLLKKTLEDGNPYTYKGMLTALKFAIEYENISPQSIKDKWGIFNIIEDYYPKAYNFYNELKEKNKDDEFIEYVLTKEPVYIIMKRSDIIFRQQRDEKERWERYIVKPMTEKDVEEIVKNYEENGTRENGIF